jgi:predicted phage-related endonuclease
MALMEGSQMAASVRAAHPWEKSAPSAAVVSNSMTAIDELGSIREQIKALETREKKLAEVVKEQGEGEHMGAKCKAVVSIVESSRLDTTLLKASLPDEMIEKFTKISKAIKVTIKPLF